MLLQRAIQHRWLVAAIPLLALLAVMPLILPRFYLYILTLIFVTALLAMSLNLVLGHGGIYQFHHAVFYGAGAYAFALLLTKTALPWWVGLVAGPFVAALLGLIIGWLCIRLTRLYFGMLQISLGSLVWAVVFRWYAFTGGDDGIHGIPIPEFLKPANHAYFFILAVLVLCVAAMYVVINSPFGRTLRAARDNPQRCEAIGVNVRLHQLVGIVIASFFAGVAGVLFVVLERTVFPNMLFWVMSLEILVMCLLGGWFTFAGPMLGAALTVALSKVVPSLLSGLARSFPAGEIQNVVKRFSELYAEYWTLILGIVLALVIFFLPEGVMGYLQKKVGARGRPGRGGKT